MNSEELRFLACGISMRALQSRSARSRGAFYESNVVSLNLREIDKNMEHLRRRDEPSARLLRGASPLRLSLPVFLAVMRALPRLLAPVVHMRVLARARVHTHAAFGCLHGVINAGFRRCRSRHDYGDRMRSLNTNAGRRERI